MDQWKNDIINWKKIDVEIAKFYLSTAERRLEEQIKTSESITSRTDKLLGISISLTTILAGYIFSLLTGNESWIWNYYTISSILALIVLILSLLFLVKNLFPFEIRIPGEDPRNIVTSLFIDSDYDSKEIYQNLVLNQLNNYQLRIDKNKEVNTKRMINNTLALRSLILLPITLIVGYLILLAF